MIYLHFDVSDLLGLGDIKEKIQGSAQKELENLAKQTHAHIVEQVQKKLHSSREKYLDALSINEVDADTWLITLADKAMWIEEGIEPNHEMIDDLLKSPKAKTAKDGSKYMVVPFEHKKGPTSQTPAAKSLTDTIKAEFKNRNIPYGKLEHDAQGKPKTGLLHQFNINNLPLKTGNGVGQGHGPIGAVKQGMTGIPLLRGIRVYQKEVKTPEGKSKIVKSIMTFRVVSSKQKGSGSWVHPGLEPKHFFEEAVEWALKEWEDKIKDKILMSIE